MSWIKLDDHFPTHPKIVAAGGDAAWLHVCALCYCGEHLTDGVFPKALVPRLSDRKNPIKLASVLVNAGIWDDTGDGFAIHDYLDCNPSREQVLSQRNAKSMAGAKGAASRWHGKNNAPVPVPVPDVPTEHLLAPTNGAAKTKATRIPDEFTVTDEMAAWALTRAPNVDWRIQTEKFVNHWKAKSGKDATKLDWPRTWRNWLLTAEEWATNKTPARTHL